MGVDNKEIDQEANPKTGVSDPGTDFEKAFKEDKLKSKMKTMQRRIDELREKVDYEGSFINTEGETLDTDFVNEGFCESSSDLQSILSQITQSSSDKSLYYSASEYSVGSSQCTAAADTGCYNFTGFVGGFSTNQHEKERFSLLRLHSGQQISFNLAKNLLEDIETRCTEELKLVGENLARLGKLAVEFGVKTESTVENRAGRNLMKDKELNLSC